MRFCDNVSIFARETRRRVQNGILIVSMVHPFKVWSMATSEFFAEKKTTSRLATVDKWLLFPLNLVNRRLNRLKLKRQRLPVIAIWIQKTCFFPRRREFLFGFVLIANEKMSKSNGRTFIVFFGWKISEHIESKLTEFMLMACVGRTERGR